MKTQIKHKKQQEKNAKYHGILGLILVTTFVGIFIIASAINSGVSEITSLLTQQAELSLEELLNTESIKNSPGAVGSNTNGNTEGGGTQGGVDPGSVPEGENLSAKPEFLAGGVGSFDNTGPGVYVARAISLILIMASVIAVIMIILSGIRYIMAAGADDKIEGAKKTLQWAIVGLLTIIFAFFIVQTIVQYLYQDLELGGSGEVETVTPSEPVDPGNITPDPSENS